MMRNMKKSQNNAAKEYLRSALSDTESRLLHNPSKGERALFVGAVLLSLVSLVLAAVVAIISKDALTIVRAFTENIIFFIMVVALTVGDKLLVYKNRCFVPIIYSLLWLARDAFALVGAEGVGVLLGAVGLCAGLALYGIIIIDQFNPNDKAFKYWLLYGGAAYKILYILVAMIINGSTASSGGAVAQVLSIVFTGVADILVLLMLIYQFDGFSFAKYVFSGIVDGDDGEEDEEFVSAPPAEADIAEDTSLYVEPEDMDDGEDAEYHPFEEIEQEAERPTDEQSCDEDDIKYPDYEQEDVICDDDMIDDEEYRPYDETEEDCHGDTGVRQVGSGEIPYEQPKESQSEPEFSDGDDDVLIDDSLIETESEHKSNVESIVDAPESKEEADAFAGLKLTPTEIKYVKFAAAHHKPEETFWVEGLAGDLFDVWVDGETICFLNDIDQATGGRGVRSAAIAFEDVEGIGYGKVGDGDCIVLTYKQNGVIRDIGFTKSSFINFKRVMTEIK